jgi:plastocyanin
MSRLRLVFVAALLVVALVAAAYASAGGSASQLVGKTGPGFTITLTQGGKKVSKLKAGKYTFVINDKSSIHSFAMDGPHKFAKDFTKIPFVGTKTVTVTLVKGTYKFYCANHESTMFGHFKVS